MFSGKPIREDNHRTPDTIRALLSRLLQNASDILWLLDDEGRITFVSPSVERLSGWDSTSLIGHTLSEFVDEEVGVALEALIEELRRQP
ncbi:MAG: PAS domain-containing protein [Chloroflexota bacterium]